LGRRRAHWLLLSSLDILRNAALAGLVAKRNVGAVTESLAGELKRSSEGANSGMNAAAGESGNGAVSNSLVSAGAGLLNVVSSEAGNWSDQVRSYKVISKAALTNLLERVSCKVNLCRTSALRGIMCDVGRHACRGVQA
jgi:hypothetical protein